MYFERPAKTVAIPFPFDNRKRRRARAVIRADDFRVYDAFYGPTWCPGAAWNVLGPNGEFFEFSAEKKTRRVALKTTRSEEPIF